MQKRIIDFHTHAFPDALAPRAMKTLLEEAPDVKAYLDGTTRNLLESMQKCGIEKSLVSCIATRPGQFESIFHWCVKSRSEKLDFLPSVHPDDSHCLEQLDRIKAEGFKGIKLHPFYQNFYADEDRLLAIYEKLSRLDMFVLMHTGFDIAFPRIRRADPQMILRIHEMFPGLKFITTHFGAWQQWDEVRDIMIGRDIYIEISFALDYLSIEQAREMMMNHPTDYLLFGTDSPWTDQAQTLHLLEKLSLPKNKLDHALYINAAKLLDIA